MGLVTRPMYVEIAQMSIILGTLLGDRCSAKRAFSHAMPRSRIFDTVLS